jgi:hypothetical protein
MSSGSDVRTAALAGAQEADPGSSKVYVYDSPTTVRILQLGEDLDGSSLLPGFRLPLADLFGQEDEVQESSEE